MTKAPVMFSTCGHRRGKDFRFLFWGRYLSRINASNVTSCTNRMFRHPFNLQMKKSWDQDGNRKGPAEGPQAQARERRSHERVV